MLAVVNIKWAVLHKVNHHCYLRFIKRKVNANREQNLSSLLEQLCRDAALLTQKYKDFLKRQNVWRIFFVGFLLFRDCVRGWASHVTWKSSRFSVSELVFLYIF